MGATRQHSRNLVANCCHAPFVLLSLAMLSEILWQESFAAVIIVVIKLVCRAWLAVWQATGLGSLPGGTSSFCFQNIVNTPCNKPFAKPRYSCVSCFTETAQSPVFVWPSSSRLLIGRLIEFPTWTFWIPKTFSDLKSFPLKLYWRLSASSTASKNGYRQVPFRGAQLSFRWQTLCVRTATTKTERVFAC